MATSTSAKPSRQRVKTVTGGPQGDAAWIELSMPTIKESQDHQRNIQELAKIDPDKANEEANAYFALHVKSWNWVGDDGEDLPHPSNPSVFETLLPDELVFVTLALSGQEGLSASRKKK